MRNHLKVLQRITERTVKNLMNNYNLTAIVLNAVEVAKTYYEQRKDSFALSTTIRIPLEFKISPVDIDKWYYKDDLVKAYSDDVITKVATDYLIHTIATIDAYIEDVHRYFCNHLVDETELKDLKIREDRPWSNDAFRRLIHYIGLQKPADHVSTIDLVLDRYEEFRFLRHAVLHQRGRLDERQIIRSEGFRERGIQVLDGVIDADEFATALDFWAKDGEVKPNITLIYMIRRWSYEFLGYMAACYEATPAINKKLDRK